MPSEKVLAGPRVREGALDVGMLRSYVLKAGGITARSRRLAADLQDGFQENLEELESSFAGSIESAKAAARRARRRVAPDAG